MERWMCPHCGEEIFGSFQVVLVLASVHRCRPRLARAAQTACLGCVRSPTGLCAFHASLIAEKAHPNPSACIGSR